MRHYFLLVLATTVVLFTAAKAATAQAMPTLAKNAGEFVNLCKEVSARQGVNNPALALGNGFCLGYLNGLKFNYVQPDVPKVGTRDAVLLCAGRSESQSSAAGFFYQHFQSIFVRVTGDTVADVTGPSILEVVRG